MIRNPDLAGWTSAGPLLPTKNAEFLPGWVMDFPDPKDQNLIELEPLGEARGFRLRVKRKLRWVRLQQALQPTPQELGGRRVRIEVRGLRRLDRDDRLSVEWIALLTEEKPGQGRSFAQRLVANPALSTTGWDLESEHELREFDPAKPLLLAIHFNAEPGAIELSRFQFSWLGQPSVASVPPKAQAPKALAPAARPAPQGTPPAAVLPPAPPPSSAPGIIGALDEVNERVVTGWCRDPARPSVPMVVDLLVDGVLAARIDCDQPQPEVLGRTPSGGRCAFSVPTPPQLRDGRPHRVALQATNAATALQNSQREVLLPAMVDRAEQRCFQAVEAFAQLQHMDVEAVAAVVFRGVRRPDITPLPLDTLAPLTIADGFCGPSLRVDDVWLADDATLMCRVIGGTATMPATGLSLAAFQADPPGRAVTRLGRQTIPNGIATTIGLSLFNPFAPVLLLVQDRYNAVLGTALLPFPSLCRGGMHEGELPLLADGGKGFGDLRAVSDMLLRDAIGAAPQAPAFSLSAIAVDARGASLSERFFDEPFQAWLAAVAGVRVRALPGEAPAQLTASLRPQGLPDMVAARMDRRESEGSVVLLLPPDALPSLSVLFSRGQDAPKDGAVVSGAIIVADALTGRPAWSLTFPPLDPTPQPRDVTACLVTAGRPLDAPRPNQVVGSGISPVPLAIRFIGSRPSG